MNREKTVKREVIEETGLITNQNLYLNWILEYESLGLKCDEYVYISFVNKDDIILNEENIDYKWCNFNEFIEKINWFSNKEKLKKVLNAAMKGQVFLEVENKDKL